MPDDIRRDYDEARAIVGASPRGAAALLRLAVQKLCAALGQDSQNLNHAIGSLVRNGLPDGIQQALDVLRVVGNNAVHPGEMDLHDDRETALSLFILLNEIVERMITAPKRLETLYGHLPLAAREAIARRDS